MTDHIEKAMEAFAKECNEMRLIRMRDGQYINPWYVVRGWVEQRIDGMYMFCVKIGGETVYGCPQETRDQAQKDLDELFQIAANSLGDYLIGGGAEDDTGDSNSRC